VGEGAEGGWGVILQTVFAVKKIIEVPDNFLPLGGGRDFLSIFYFSTKSLF